MWWLFLIYACLLGGVVVLSNKVATYTDFIEKNTKLTGALLGGVILAGITSLPELVTGITSSLLGEPELVQGDIFGSNIFDVFVIGLIMFSFIKTVRKTDVSKDNAKFVVWCLIIAFVIGVSILVQVLCNVSFVIPYINVNALTIVCIALYVIALLTTSKTEDVEEENAEQQKEQSDDKSSIKSVVTKFIICSIILIGVSIAITFTSNIIANEYGLGKGLAGALFLGVATSLPEIISSFTLVKLGNYNAAYGNIIGSCLFNFMVLGITDVFFFSGTVFVVNMQSFYATLCMFVAMFAMLMSYVFKKPEKKLNAVALSVCASVIIAAYVVFLVVLA